MQKFFSILVLAVLLYSCSTNNVIGPNNVSLNRHDTILIQSIDSFSIYNNGSDVSDSITITIAQPNVNDLIVMWTGETNHPELPDIDTNWANSVDSAALIVLKASDTTFQDTTTVIYRLVDSLHIVGNSVFATQRHSELVFSRLRIQISITKNFKYHNGSYFIRMKNIKIYRVT